MKSSICALQKKCTDAILYHSVKNASYWWGDGDVVMVVRGWWCRGDGVVVWWCGDGDGLVWWWSWGGGVR